MFPPTIKGYKIQAEIGTGSAGTVYEAIRQDGVAVAIKVFDTMGSNPGLIRGRMQRLIESGVENATVPILAEALNIRPACVVMPLLAEKHGDGSVFVPRTLQAKLGEFMGTEKSRPFVRKLAQRLAALHAARVAHGNLKPGNVFLDDKGNPLVSDYASGLMPEVHHLGFSDALLYSPPEQLRDPGAYLDEAGYRWDVFAFGVLSFRLLTGQFPRCQSIFASVCPASGDRLSGGIEAEYEGIATGLEEDERVSWPTEAADQREEKYRKIIDVCLVLDPHERPADMREVSWHFERVEEDLESERINMALVDQKEEAELRRGIAVGLTKKLAVIALGLGTMWAWTQYQRGEEALAARKEFSDYQSNAVTTIESLENDAEAARKAEELSKNLSDSLREALLSEQENAVEELRAAQVSNERLMKWVLEKGVNGMPVLEGRKGRLSVLAEELEEQIAGLVVRPGLEQQVALLRYRLAEVLLSSGKENEGEEALRDVMLNGEGYLTPSHEVEGLLRLYLLRSARKEPVTQGQLDKLRSLITQSWSKGEDEHLRYGAALELVAGRQAGLEEKTAEAQTAYAASLKSFEELAKRYPETPPLRMGLGRAYQEAALASEISGDIAHTSALREKAASEFLRLAEDPRTKAPELEYQIAAVKAAKAIAAWQSGRSFTAEKLAREGIIKLSEIQNKMPNDFRVATTLASQRGIIATVLRDQGDSTRAATLLIQSINTLEAGLKGESMNWDARYLLASLKWQLSGIHGQKGQNSEEVKLGTEARDQLRLILDAGVRTPHPHRVKTSLAYLCGDLGHSASLSGKRSLGVAFLRESKESWESILASNPKSTEAREGISWVSQRLREMGSR
ncbi:MAG: protein kinase domain-containing protein [Akkermansiaceae bacterium]